MSGEASGGGTLQRWYRDRIGEPSTNDESTGYWVFSLGVVLGIAGILAFLQGAPASGTREVAITLASAGFALLLAGPIIRLPLRRSATWLVYLGLLLCAAAIAWFVMAFPAEWSPQSGQPTIIMLYTAGLVVMAVGGVFVPILTTGPEREASLRADLESARADVVDTEADEADLAAQLRALRTSQARFELYEDRGGAWRWRLRHRNGNVIADGGEGYSRRIDAQNGLASVRRNALGATLLLVPTADELPAEGEAFEPVAETESQATYELYEDTAGEYRWRLVHQNGNVLADGSEGYGSRRSASDAIEGVKGYVGPADYVRPDPTAFEIYRDRAGEYRWRLVHENGEILADGGQGYVRRSDVSNIVERLRTRFDDYDAELYSDRGGEHRWRLRAANDEIVADSGEGYAAADGAEDALERLATAMADADVLVVGRAAFEVYEDAGEEWRWRLRHRNGNVLADSGEGYDDRSGAWEGIERVKRHGPNATVEG